MDKIYSPTNSSPATVPLPAPSSPADINTLNVPSNPPMDEITLTDLQDIWEHRINDVGGEIPLVSLDYFQDSVLPPLEQCIVDCTLEDLESSGHIVDDRWTAFPEDPLVADGIDDFDIFASLQNLCLAIVTAAQQHTQKAPSSEIRMETPTTASQDVMFMVDGVSRLLKSKGAGTGPDWSLTKSCMPSSGTDTGDLSTVSGAANSLERPTSSPKTDEVVLLPQRLCREAADAAWSMHLSKSASPQTCYENIGKSITAAAHILQNDPCRRFIFSLTVENTSARLWFYSRYTVMVTECFNFITERHRLVRFILSLAFASESELGYDPSVQRIIDYENDGPCVAYDILVRGEWYRTLRWLDTYRSSRITSRATRVWEVRLRSDPPGAKTFALKDVWLCETALSEKTILEDIFSKVNTVHPIDDFEKDYKKYFMTILADECVCIDGQPDRTSSLLLRNHPFPEEHGWFSLDPFGLEDTELNHRLQLPKAPKFEPKQHRRILFDEVGRTLDNILNHQEVFRALGTAVKGLKYLYSAGYVHRDISTGNLLLCGDVCKIADFEYAKSYEDSYAENGSSPSLHTFKTGTPAFMAVEIQNEQELFAPPPTRPRPQRRSRELRPAPKTPAFRHNYLHDIESVWWIGVWMLFTTVPEEYLSLSALPDSVKAQVAVSKDLFPPNVSGSNFRTAFFLSRDDEVSRYMDGLPQEYQSACDAMLDVSYDLRALYISLEKDVGAFRKAEGFKPAYPTLLAPFLEAAETAHPRVIPATDWRPPKAGRPGSPKRLADEVEGTTESSDSKRRRT